MLKRTRVRQSSGKLRERVKYTVLEILKELVLILQGIKCGFQMCKTCCRDLCYTKDLECVGHKFLLEKRQRRAQKQKFEATNDISQAQIVINDEEVKTVK